MQSLSPLILLSVGLVLIFLEITLYSFFIIWIGLAFVIVALIEFLFPLNSLWVQVAIVSGLSLVLFMLFYKSLTKFVHKNNEVSDDFIEQNGVGVIKNQMLNYQGSYFKVQNLDITNLENTEVKVIKVEKNNAWVELIHS